MKVIYSHTNIVARDWRSLAQFYIDVFGCTPKPPERDLGGPWLDRLTAIDGVSIRGMHLVLPGFDSAGPTLEIFQYGSNVTGLEKAINGEGFGHIAFAVEDVDECLSQIISHGGSTVGEVVRGTVDGVGSIHLVYARDPEGNIIEVQRWT